MPPIQLTEQSPAARNAFAQRVLTHQFGVLESLALPSAFDLASTDVVVLRSVEGFQLFIDARANYRGSSPEWHDVMAGSPSPGDTRLVLTAPSPETALLMLEAMLSGEDAPGFSQSAGSRPRTAPGHARRGVDETRPTPTAITPELAGDPQPRARLDDLVAQHADLGPIPPSRVVLVDALLAGLCRKSQGETVLVGPRGVGKSCVARLLGGELARRAAPESGRALPASLLDPHLYELRLGELADGGASMLDLLDEVQTLCTSPDRPMFFLDDLHLLWRAELSRLRDILRPAILAGSVRAVGATTPGGWQQVDNDPFKTRFTELVVPEPTRGEAIAMVTAQLAAMEEHHALQFGPPVVAEAVLLADQFLASRAFPGKALELLDEAAGLRSLGGPSMPSPPVAGPSAGVARPTSALSSTWVRRAVSNQSGVSLEFIDPDLHEALVQRARVKLQSQLFGQGVVVDEVIAALGAQLSLRALEWRRLAEDPGRRAERRPLATVLACGPTGVGKTETARVMAAELFGGNLIMLNGTDVGPESPHNVSTWVGSPKGYTGSQTGGSLTNGLRRHPGSVILIDEIEKASPEAIQNVLLPLLGDGVVVDRNTGDTLSAYQCVVFCTSNILIPETMTDVSEVHQVLAARLRHETIGRFNRILRYGALTHQAKWRVWDALTADVGHSRPGVRVVLTQAGRMWLETEFGRSRTGARGVQDIFRQQMAPLMVGARVGDLVVGATPLGLVAAPL